MVVVTINEMIQEKAFCIVPQSAPLTNTNLLPSLFFRGWVEIFWLCLCEWNPSASPYELNDKEIHCATFVKDCFVSEGCTQK